MHTLPYNYNNVLMYINSFMYRCPLANHQGAHTRLKQLLAIGKESLLGKNLD